MNVVKLSAVVASSLLLAPACLVEGENVESESLEMVGHNCEAEAVMQTGDFDGDGTITSADIAMLEAYKDAGDYAAFFDMNDDGKLDGQDVAAVAMNLGDAGSARDAQMAALWATVEPYRNIYNAIADGYVPLTPDLYGHGVHWARLDLVYSWVDRGGFDPGLPEGLNYSASGELLAAFYYGVGAAATPTGVLAFGEPNAFAGGMPHDWHQHVGACFGRLTLDNNGLPGFNQCLTQAECESYTPIPGIPPEYLIWSPQFHMLHVWIVEHNECGVYGGIDPDVSVGAPHEPNHGDCTIEDVLPPGTPITYVPSPV